MDRDVQKNARANYVFDQPRGTELFCFQPIPVSFGSVGKDTCGMALYPNAIRDMIDFSLRGCVAKNIPVRRAKTAAGTSLLLAGPQRSIAAGRSHLGNSAGISLLCKSGQRTARRIWCSVSAGGSINGTLPGSGRGRFPRGSLPTRSRQRRKSMIATQRNSPWMSSRNG